MKIALINQEKQIAIKSSVNQFGFLMQRRRLLIMSLAYFLLLGISHAQVGFATSEITNPIRNLVTIANAAIAGLAILAVIYYAIRWIGGDEGAAKKIIGVIVVAVIALGAANFLGWVTGKAEFDTFTN